MVWRLPTKIWVSNHYRLFCLNLGSSNTEGNPIIKYPSCIQLELYTNVTNNVQKFEKYGFYLLTKYIIVVNKHGSLTRRKKALSPGMTHAQMTTWCSFDALAGFTSQLLGTGNRTVFWSLLAIVDIMTDFSALYNIIGK